MEYADGTSLEIKQPYGLSCRGYALCPDGKVRAFRGTSADTWFSIPAKVSAQGTSVTGYVYVETRDGFETVTQGDPALVKFRPYLYGKNHALVS